MMHLMGAEALLRLHGPARVRRTRGRVRVLREAALRGRVAVVAAGGVSGVGRVAVHGRQVGGVRHRMVVVHRLPAVHIWQILDMNKSNKSPLVRTSLHAAGRSSTLMVAGAFLLVRK